MSETDDQTESYYVFNEDEIVAELNELRDEVPIDRIQTVDNAIMVIQVLWGAVRAQLGETNGKD